MSHIHHYIPQTSFDSLVNTPNKGGMSAKGLIERLRKNYVWALEGTPDLDGKKLWTHEWDEQAWRQININFMQVGQFNVLPHVLYLPVTVFQQISNSKWQAFEILLKTTHRKLSSSDWSIARVLSDKDNMFMYRTSLGEYRQLEDSVGQIREELSEVFDIPEEVFFEWLQTNPNDIKWVRPGIVVEWYEKDHRVDENWTFQARIREWAEKAGKIIEWIDNKDWNLLWDWNPRFNFNPPSSYYHS